MTHLTGPDVLDDLLAVSPQHETAWRRGWTGDGLWGVWDYGLGEDGDFGVTGFELRSSAQAWLDEYNYQPNQAARASQRRVLMECHVHRGQLRDKCAEVYGWEH